MTTPSTKQRGNGTVLAAQRLRELIVSGELKPGQRISERLVSEQLEGLSRTPLREAFKVLEVEGLVTIQPNRGAVVTALTVDEVGAAIEVLIGLESLAAEPACACIDDAELAEIEDLHLRMEEAYRQGQLMPYFHLNQAIHERIVEAARNPVLTRIYTTECARIRRYRYAGNLQAERWESAIQEHRAILQALKQRAGSLLRELLRSHHKSGWSVSRAMIEREQGAASAPAVAPRRRRVAV